MLPARPPPGDVPLPAAPGFRPSAPPDRRVGHRDALCGDAPAGPRIRMTLRRGERPIRPALGPENKDSGFRATGLQIKSIEYLVFHGRCLTLRSVHSIASLSIRALAR